MLKYVKIKNHIFNHANYHVISYLQGNFSCELTENCFMNVNVRQRKSVRFIFTIYDLQQFLKRLEDLEKHTKVKVFQYEKSYSEQAVSNVTKRQTLHQIFPVEVCDFSEKLFCRIALNKFFRIVQEGCIWRNPISHKQFFHLEFLWKN